MGLARASAGAIIFSLPLLMTMEMWWLGFYLDPLMLVQFSIVNFAVLVGLSRVSGFEETDSRIEDVLDAFAAYAVGVIAAAVVLYLFGPTCRRAKSSARSSSRLCPRASAR